VNGDVFLFEDFQDTDVGNTAGESTPQSNSYPGTGARGGMLALAATDLAAQTPYRLNDCTYYSQPETPHIGSSGIHYLRN
jgi:hypothetical protein